MNQSNTDARSVTEKILKFLSDEEINSLAKERNIRYGISREKTVEEIVGLLESLPRYERVRVILQAAKPTLMMLQDVFEILRDFNTSVRTTGFIFTLAQPSDTGSQSILEISPQAMGWVSALQPDQDWSLPAPSLDVLVKTWRRIEPVWMRVLDESRPPHPHDIINWDKTAWEGKIVNQQIRHEPDEIAQSTLRFLKSKLAIIESKLKDIPRSDLPKQLKWIQDGIHCCIDDSEEVLGKSQSRRSSQDPGRRPTEREMLEYISRKELLALDRFQEDIFLMLKLIKGEQLFDILKLDVWSSRPQLYEIWLMLTLLRWLDRRGYRVKLLKIEAPSPGSPFHWNLAYTHENKPCAMVQAGKDHQYYLFYQLYRKSGDMPDICLLKGENPNAPPVWSIDAKHSERSSYSIKEYRQTAERYRDSFGAPKSLVVEYFMRKECKGKNPFDFGNGAALIHDCYPGHSGVKALFDELDPFHPKPTRILVCIDLSNSFKSELKTTLSTFRNEVQANSTTTKYLDEFVCFAGNVECQKGLSTWLSGSHHLPDPPPLSPGTAAAVLKEEIAKIIKREFVTDVLLITDGEFDIPGKQFIADLVGELHVNVCVMPHTPNEVDMNS